MAQVSPLYNDGMSRACAFQRLGVDIAFPARSRSGVRSEDGMVVFAMPAAAVGTGSWGSYCLLWLPARAGAGGLDPAVDELREHCRLAMRHGQAEGFVIHSHGASEVFALRVAKRGAEYWAKWGGAARMDAPGSRLQLAAAQAR